MDRAPECAGTDTGLLRGSVRIATVAVPRRLDVIETIAGAPLWELGIASRDEVFRGAAGPLVLAAYRSQCRRPVDGQAGGPVEVQVAREAPDTDEPHPDR
ncbi:hypothetical protein ACI8AA_23640 [Geodermatophilus sp. SYSU D01180]